MNLILLLTLYVSFLIDYELVFLFWSFLSKTIVVVLITVDMTPSPLQIALTTILSILILFYLVLSYLILSYLILSYLILSYLILSYICLLSKWILQVLSGINATTGSSKAFGKAFSRCASIIFNVTTSSVAISSVTPLLTQRRLSSSDSLSSGNTKHTSETFFCFFFPSSSTSAYFETFKIIRSYLKNELNLISL